VKGIRYMLACNLTFNEIGVADNSCYNVIMWPFKVFNNINYFIFFYSKNFCLNFFYKIKYNSFKFIL
jgi:hypothetical protein